MIASLKSDVIPQGDRPETEWRSFEDVITKSMESFRQAQSDPSHHFVHAPRMVGLGSGAQRQTDDWILSRGACYVLAMNGDSRKPDVGFAQLYFALRQWQRRSKNRKGDGATRRPVGCVIAHAMNC